MIGRMQKLRVPSASWLAIGAACLALGSARANQASAPADKLPEAPGKAVLMRMCTVCHGTDLITDTSRTAPLWADTLLLMKDFGAEGSEEDWKTVSDYLMAHLAHLDVNKATAVEIEKVFSVNQKVAEGVVAYRDKQGGFKTIDDLKKAPDLDATKIDELKPRLIFGN